MCSTSRRASIIQGAKLAIWQLGRTSTLTCVPAVYILEQLQSVKPLVAFMPPLHTITKVPPETMGFLTRIPPGWFENWNRMRVGQVTSWLNYFLLERVLTTSEGVGSVRVPG